MLTKKQRRLADASIANRGLGIERFKTDHRARDVEEAERQVIDAAFALMGVTSSELMAGQWREYMALDYALEALSTARNRMEEIPPLPSYVEGWGPEHYCRMCECSPCSCQ